MPRVDIEASALCFMLTVKGRHRSQTFSRNPKAEWETVGEQHWSKGNIYSALKEDAETSINGKPLDIHTENILTLIMPQFSAWTSTLC